MPARTKRGQTFSPPLHLEVDCTFASVRACAAKVRSYLAGRGVAEKEIWACELAFVEGCNNAVQHTPRAHSSEKIEVDLSLRNGEIELRIKDHTSGFEFPPDSILPPDENESGRGIFLMRSLMDDVTYTRKDSTNCLVLKKALTGI